MHIPSQSVNLHIALKPMFYLLTMVFDATDRKRIYNIKFENVQLNKRIRQR
jgi:hypothetical protein